LSVVAGRLGHSDERVIAQVYQYVTKEFARQGLMRPLKYGSKMGDASELCITPVSPVLGAEVRGLDLAEGVDDATFSILHRAFLEHGVLLFKNQTAMPVPVQLALCRRLGPLHEHSAAPSDQDYPALLVFRTHRDSKVSSGNGWHTDVSCEAEPPSATMLQIRVTPPDGGGDTLFADMEAAYATLVPARRRRLCGLTARHAMAHWPRVSEHLDGGPYRDPSYEPDADPPDVDLPEAIHPVVRTHPETGRRSLYVNPSFTVSIEGLEDADGRDMLESLHRHCARPEFQIRQRWQVNDVALWDNRRVQHFPIWDYWPHERCGNRVTVRGDRPFFDPAGEDPPPSILRLSEQAL
jgi:taurine dioxygenase